MDLIIPKIASIAGHLPQLKHGKCFVEATLKGIKKKAGCQDCSMSDSYTLNRLHSALTKLSKVFT